MQRLNQKFASARIVNFAKKYGEAHLNLACHAAFPIVLTPDLLFHLWANFMPTAPWVAVADILLSNLCTEVGCELYEMNLEIRNILLKDFAENKMFGQKRINSLADFMLEYVSKQLINNGPDYQELSQAQYWTALAYTRPTEAAHDLALELSKLKINEKTDVIRITSIVETLVEPLKDFTPLLFYSKGMGNLVRNNLKAAATYMHQAFGTKEYVDVAGAKISNPASRFLKAQRNIENTAHEIDLEKIIYPFGEKDSSLVKSISDVEEKMRFKGKIGKITLAGAMVNIGLEVQGVIHISQLSEGYVNKVEDVVTEGQTVDVWVRRVKKDRIELTMVRPLPLELKKLQKDTIIIGKVVRIESYGAFVDIGAERPGLIHVSEIASRFTRHPSEKLVLGEEIKVKVIGVDIRKKQIQLSIKALSNKPISPTESQKQEDEIHRVEQNEEDEPTAMEIALRKVLAQLEIPTNKDEDIDIENSKT